MSDAKGPTEGLRGRVELRVGEGDTAVALGSGDVRVLGTPRVVALLEEAACAALAGTLAEGRTTVGVHVDLRHLKPSPVGSVVVAVATVTAVDGRFVDFELEATMGDEVVASGTHRRVTVPQGFGES